jgi:hypothetical protein
MKKILAACLVPACIATVAIIAAVPTSLIVNSPIVQAAPVQKATPVETLEDFQGDGFTIQMPGTPKVETSSATIGKDQAPVTSYAVIPSADMGYVVMVMEMPISVDPKSSMAQDFLNGMEKDAGKTFTSTVVAKKSLTLSGNPGREMTLSDRDGFGKTRIFLVQNRMYMLMAGGKSGQANKQNIDTFLQSFKLIDQ